MTGNRARLTPHPSRRRNFNWDEVDDIVASLLAITRCLTVVRAGALSEREVEDTRFWLHWRAREEAEALDALLKHDLVRVPRPYGALLPQTLATQRAAA